MRKRKKTVVEVQIAVSHSFQGEKLEWGRPRQGREHRLDDGYEGILGLGGRFAKGSAVLLNQVVYLPSFCI